MRARKHEATTGGRDVAQMDGTVLRQVLGQVVCVVALGGTGADHVVVIVGQLGHRELGADSAALGQRMAQRNATDLGRHLVGDKMVQPLYVGKTVSLAGSTGNNDRAEVWVYTTQGDKVKIIDQYVPFRSYNS